jgi:16S rRNA (adenine1518-N6/adenine1519-N6)-dimethyltransferase
MGLDWRAAVAALPPLRDVLAQHNLVAKKSLGQNFITDSNVTRKIARFAAPFQEGSVYEIGPGPGGLTRALFLEGADQVTAFEKDPRAVAALASLQEATQNRLHLQLEDALTVDYRQRLDHPAILVGNLPYNIATQLLFLWLDAPQTFCRLVLMFQKEVANRLIASPDSKTYGRLSVLTQARFKADIVYILPPSLFTPAPKVTSALVKLSPLQDLLSDPLWEALKLVTRHAFSQRRKMLKSTLKPLGLPFMDALEAMGISLTDRAEVLSVPTYVAMAQTYLSRQTA